MKIGIDIGGSHIGIGLVNSNGTIILKLEVKIIKQKSSIGIGEAIATVNGEIVAKGELTFAVV